jgi:hypothetical protein
MKSSITHERIVSMNHNSPSAMCKDWSARAGFPASTRKRLTHALASLGVLVATLSAPASPNLIIEQPAGTNLTANAQVYFGGMQFRFVDPTSIVQALDKTFTVTFTGIPKSTFSTYLIQQSASIVGPWSALFAPGLEPDGAGMIVFHDPSPRVNSFYRLFISTDTQRTFTLRNTGDTDANGIGVTVGGTDATNFELDVSTTDAVLPPGAITTFSITYVAGDTNPRAAELNVTANIAVPLSVNLVGGDLPAPVKLFLIWLGNGNLRLSWTNSATGSLETSTNLAPNSWSPAGPAAQQPDGSWRFDAAPVDPVRFYRFKL